jgi:prepilin-type N-terminal cleavage/methylation domain-containing protein
MRSNRAAGFTLVEMLVVIGIIAILVGILWPVLSRARIKARQAKCTTQLHQLVVALKLYSEDYQAYPQWPTWNPGAGPTGRFTGGFSALYPDYITDENLLICPDDQRALNIVKQAKDRAYSSYNADFGDLGLPDFIANPATYLDTDAAGRTYLKKRLYNYFGYLDGYPGATDLGYDGYQLSTFVGPENASTLPWWLSEKGLSWRYYPRLMNKYAPDNTIAVHCVRHRRYYDAKQQRDIVIRLGGDAKTIYLTDMAATISPSAGGTAVSGWVHQRY